VVTFFRSPSAQSGIDSIFSYFPDKFSWILTKEIIVVSEGVRGIVDSFWIRTVIIIARRKTATIKTKTKKGDKANLFLGLFIGKETPFPLRWLNEPSYADFASPHH
jgi:hypothetical protein